MDEKNLKKEFEDLVINAHAEQYEGLDDEMPDDYEEWLIDLEPDDWLNLGADFAAKKIERINLKEKAERKEVD